MDIPLNKYDIYIECGADFSLSFVIRDDSGTLVNLSGAIVEAQLKEYAESQEYLLFTAFHNGAGGRITITMPHEDTANIAYTYGVYDVFLTLDGVTEKIVYGDVTVYPNATKPVEGEVIYLLSFNTEEDFPAVGKMRRAYFSHASNRMYRWNGTAYVGMNGKTYWDQIEDKPETFPPSEHDHDDRYYTETETDTLLSGKSDVEHNHDDRYYTNSETDTLLSGKSDTDHTHDDRYYTESEVDTALAGKSDTTHNHDDRYSQLGHTHDDRYYTETEIDNALSAKADIADLGDLAEKDTVDWDSDITNIPEDFPPSEHDHDDRYYTESEMDTLLSAKADSADLGDLATKDTVNYETDIDNLPTLGALAAKDTVDWDTDIDDIPSTFPPSTHTHTTSDITDFPTLGTMSAESASDYYNKTATDALLSEKADIIHSSASSALVHLTDAGAYTVDSLSVGIEPVQDLHGYDAPWPAGGGKNLLNPSAILGTQAVFSNDGDLFTVVNSSGGTRIIYKHLFKADTSYTISATMVSGTHKPCIIVRNTDGTSTGQVSNYANNANPVTVTFTEDREWNVILQTNSASDTVVNGEKFKIQIQQGSTATSYAPYSNVCPISGWSEAKVTRTGRNLFDKVSYPLTAERWISRSNGDVVENAPNWACTVDYIPFDLPAGTVVNLNHVPGGTWPGMAFYDNNKTFISGEKGNAITVPLGCAYMRFTVDVAYADGNDVQLEIGSTATAYAPYSGTSVTVDLDGTRYGAQLNVLTGELTVDRAYALLNDPDKWVDATGNILFKYNQQYTDRKLLGNSYDGLSCSYIQVNINNSNNTGRWQSADSYYFGIKNSNLTLNQIKTDASAGKIAILYELATPLTVQLSPATLSLLLGENNIWSDTGDTSVGYRADTKRYIDQQIASRDLAIKSIMTNVESAMKATKNYTSGQVVIVGDSFYKLTANVSSGGNLTVGSNCQKVTMAEWILSIV